MTAPIVVTAAQRRALKTLAKYPGGGASADAREDRTMRALVAKGLAVQLRPYVYELTDAGRKVQP